MPPLLSHTYAPHLFLFFYAGVHSCVTLGRNSDFLFIYFPSFSLSLWHSLLPLLLQLIPWFMHNYVHSECTSVCIHSQRVSEWVSVFVCPAHKSNTKCEFRICNQKQQQRQQQHHNSSKCQTAKNVDMIVMLRGWLYPLAILPSPSLSLSAPWAL